MARISFLNIFATLSVLWLNVRCSSFFIDPLAPRLVEDNLVSYIDLPDNGTQELTIRLDIPELAEKSARIKLVLDPAVWGKPVEVQLSMNNTQPSSSSSDVALVTTFVQNVAIVDYLSRTGGVLEKNATLLLENTYRAVLKFRRNDGSFGVSGSSVFLTAFMIKGLQVADRYISLNEGIVDDALKWLAEQQQSEGQFVEVEPMVYEKMRSLRLTAYVLTIFGSELLREVYPGVANKAAAYVANKTEHMNTYELALSAFALSLVNHTKSSYCLEQLNQPKETYWRGKSSNGEIAGYAMMASLNNFVYTNTEDIVQWLKTRSFSSYGDIQHTLNRVTALQALQKLFERFSKYRNNYTVRLRYKSKTLNLHQNDAKMVELDLPSNTKLVQATVQGTGFGRLQIAYRYERKVSATEGSFALNVELLNTTTATVQNLRVCVGRGRTNGLTLVEVFLPKGFTSQDVQDLSPLKQIWKTLSRSNGSSIVVYYESLLGRAMNCFVVTASRQLKPGTKSDDEESPGGKQMDVIAYDYYNQDRVAWASYKGFTGRQSSENDDYEYLEAV